MDESIDLATRYRIGRDFTSDLMSEVKDFILEPGVCQKKQTIKVYRMVVPADGVELKNLCPIKIEGEILRLEGNLELNPEKGSNLEINFAIKEGNGRVIHH